MIVPLAVGPPSDEGLVSWQGTPLTGLGGGNGTFWVTSLACCRGMGLAQFFFFEFAFIRCWMTSRRINCLMGEGGLQSE